MIKMFNLFLKILFYSNIILIINLRNIIMINVLIKKTVLTKIKNNMALSIILWL